ncbi:MAG: GNAT family N-acyltransferase [Waterburya sp.]
MTILIEQASDLDCIESCRQILVDVFHDELKLYGMQIPDKYEQISHYMQILYADILVGTYRIVVPNCSCGMPIEETGFDINKFSQENVCEMSRLAIIKEARGKIIFNKIIFSACIVAKSYGATTLLIEILPQNLHLFQRQGFEQIGEPIKDITVRSINNKESIVIPMQKHL